MKFKQALSTYHLFVIRVVGLVDEREAVLSQLLLHLYHACEHPRLVLQLCNYELKEDCII